MKELLERLVEVGVEFGIMDRVKSGVRSWEEMVGMRVSEDKEEFIKRCIIGCGLNFNYVEEGVEGLKSEVLWEWVRGGYVREELKKFNLVEVREEIYDYVVWWLGWWMGSFDMKLSEMVKEGGLFWGGMNNVFGGDVVSKKVCLCRMMLKESGVEIWGMERKEIVVDYNMMGVFKFMGLVDYEGDFKDDKEVIDKVRVECYGIMEKLLEVCDMGDDWLDGLLFWVGRKLREKGLVNVGLYNGCVDF